MKYFLLLSTLFLLASCGSTPTETTQAPPAPAINDAAPDVKTVLAQVCKDKDSTCKQLLCTKDPTTAIFACSDSTDTVSTCSEEKKYDEIIDKYKICSNTPELLTHSIFNYSEGKNDYFTSMTPAELEAKLTEETAKVEAGGTSDFLGPFLASMGGALVGGMIANALFGNSSAQMPPQKPGTEIRQIDKSALDATKKESASATLARNESRKQALTDRVNKAKQNIQENKATKSSSSSKKKRR